MNNKFIKRFFVIIGSAVALIGLLASYFYFNDFFINDSKNIDDLLSGIVTFFFIFPLGFWMIAYAVSIWKSNNLTATNIKNIMSVNKLLGVFFALGTIVSTYAAIKYELAFLATSAVLLIMAFVMLFLSYLFNDNSAGIIIKKKVKKYLFCALTDSYYIDGVDALNPANYKIINRKIKVYLHKKCLGNDVKTILLHGKTKKLYLAIYDFDENTKLIYSLNLKTLVSINLYRNFEDEQINHDNAVLYIKSLNSDYKFFKNISYTILKENDLYSLSIYIIHPYVDEKMHVQTLYLISSTDYCFESENAAFVYLEQFLSEE